MANVSAVGDPTKDFFVFMITKDLDLADCIFDLIDNCIDGARKAQKLKGQPSTDLAGYSVKLTFGKESFRIEDNGSGISVKEARESAFRFGRKYSEKPETEHGIGLYGIGMKRAMFKLGNVIQVRSSTLGESFVCNIDVQTWLKLDKWDFDLDVGGPNAASGTILEVTKLHEEISRLLVDPVFLSKLNNAISRDYSLLLQNGLEIKVNGQAIKPFIFTLMSGGGFNPLSRIIEQGDVKVALVAGLAHVPSEDVDADAPPTTVG